MANHPGPTELLLVRHGQSTGNVASAAADREGAERIDIDLRDADVPLSDTGEDQARSLGRWFAEQGPSAAPQRVWSSPFLRARETARIAVETAGLDVPVRLDERLRDRDLGILDLYSATGVKAHFPEEAERRAWHGKFYYRPPGGESWADVALRVRAFLGDLERSAAGTDRVLVAAHDAVIMVFRYVCEGMTEQEVLAAARERSVSNASVTRLRRSPDDDPWTWRADLVSADEHLTPARRTDEAGSTDVG
ncbi:histidine phosphatase family protein [Sanguibacter suaedae]|uniref:phosphoglycerate mutase (2,3-diphosphoglycerate-dependent) n=1 Tax=Sanguibacter suaedae TaxID=2795737 RepID=A0A934M9U2_9MICO|nr:histidine phosphatase family protein [Sanguibacter suaedae]MBI9113531.1 histidine phosphatase family protein [Sanguibacter suaedae]